MEEKPSTDSEREATAASAAAGFHTAEAPSDVDVELEFLFTRAIEFRQETIYFVLVDRFHDGDPDNNEGPHPQLYDATRQHWGKYWGGDLQGIIDKLD
jgi:cyclomaltodextrin glucanotransferase